MSSTSLALRAAPAHPPHLASEGVFPLRQESFRARVERVFAEAKLVIMERRGVLGSDGRPMLGPTMAWEDWHVMTDGHPVVAACMDILRTDVERILSEFGLHEYHVIPEEMRFSGRADGVLSERSLLDRRVNLLTTKDSRVVLHPSTWAKLDGLADEYRAKFGKPLSMTSGYRSDAYQLYLLAYNASRMDDPANPGKKLVADRPLEEVFRTVAPPFCSEHSMRVPAFDIGNFMDRPHDLRSTEEWIWFREAARTLGIVESYPDGSINGGYGEPWHFRDETSA